MQDSIKKAFGSKNPLDAYRKTEVMTANRETVLLMLYAGAIRFLKQSIDFTEKGILPEKAKYLSKTMAIVTELQASLNFEVGGEIAKTLEGLYGFITHRLLTASAEKSTAPQLEALKVLETLNEAWEGAVASLRKEKPANEK